MSLLDRLRAWREAPRFCRGCGDAIKVVNRPSYDKRTGAEIPHWFWHCPELSIQTEGGSIRSMTWYGGKTHDAGNGMPGWYEQ